MSRRLPEREERASAPAAEAGESWYGDGAELLRRSRACRSADHPAPRVPGYSDLSLFRRGGQGTVYLATRQRDGARLALKVFHQHAFESKRAERRFEREIHLVARLRHPCIVRLVGSGHVADGRAFLAMEFVAGSSFEEALNDRPVDDILLLFEDVAEAVEHAHRRGVLHRDLKPSNIRVDRTGRVRLLDFGLACSLDSSIGGASVTLDGEFVGSLAWSSPEQLSGDADALDTRSDLYALGLLLYWALAARLPFPAGLSAPALVHHRQTHAPMPLRRAAPELSRDLETVVMRCLAEEPDRRYASVTELREELERLRTGEPIAARRDSLPEMLRALSRRHRAAVMVAVVSALLLVTSTAFALVKWRAALADEKRADQAVVEKRAEAERVGMVNEFLLGALLNPQPFAEVAERKLVDAVDAAAATIEQDPTLSDRPDVRAELHSAFAYWFAALPDRLDLAEEHLLQAWELDRSQPTPDPARLAATLGMRGLVALRQSRYPEAVELLEDAIPLAVPGSVHMAHLVTHLGQAHLNLGDFARAEELLSLSLELFRENLGDEHPQTQAIERGLEMVRRGPP